MKRLATLLAIALLAAGYASAQDLLRNNPNYLRARDLQLRAQQSFDNGEYEQAQQQAQEAEKLIKIAQEQAQTRLLQLRANGYRQRAERRIQEAAGMQPETRYPDVWRRANQAYKDAVDQYAKQLYQQSIASSQSVLSLLEGVVPARAK